jgi:hypothetical protein
MTMMSQEVAFEPGQDNKYKVSNLDISRDGDEQNGNSLFLTGTKKFQQGG